LDKVVIEIEKSETNREEEKMLKNKESLHGGDIYQKNPTEKEWLDFSANINFLGMPEKVRQAATEAITLSTHYPDSKKRELTYLLAEQFSLSEEMILWGNGAAELLYAFSFALHPEKGLLAVPAFLEYERALSASGCQISYVFLKRKEQFYFTKEIQKELLEKVKEADVLILCNPNNPTGWQIPKDFLLECMEECERKKTYFLLDECFLEFTENGNSLLSFCLNHPHLIVLRAFTKMYAMPGLRLGYAISGNFKVRKAMELAMQPWNVSLPAQMAGIAALSEKDYPARTRQALKKERIYLISGLEYFRDHFGLVAAIYGAEANFIFFSGERELAKWLKQKGILIRDCSNYRGLCLGDFRICIKNREENQRLLDAITELAKK